MGAMGFDYDGSEYLQQYMVNGKEPDYNLGIAVAAADQFLDWLKESYAFRYMPTF